MGVFRVEKNKNYTVMSNTHLQDKNLSLKAKGLLSQMLSLPEDWDYTLRGLASINKESINTISAIVNELIGAGYIIRQQTRKTAGRFGDIDYVIFESPEQRDQYVQLSEQSVNVPVEDQSNSPQNSPCHKNCDTAENVATGGFEPCHKKRDTEKRDTDFCDANQILNKQNTNIINQSINPITNINYKTGPPVDCAARKERVVQQKEYLEYCRQVAENVKSNIGYDALIHDRPDEIGLIDTIVESIMDVLMETSPIVHVGSRDRPTEVVRARFHKLTVSHIVYVMDSVSETTTQITNLKAYIKTSLYNALDTMELYYNNRVKSDMRSSRTINTS